jgi:hypothetical protein
MPERSYGMRKKRLSCNLEPGYLISILRNWKTFFSAERRKTTLKWLQVRVFPRFLPFPSPFRFFLSLSLADAEIWCEEEDEAAEGVYVVKENASRGRGREEEAVVVVELLEGEEEVVSNRFWKEKQEVAAESLLEEKQKEEQQQKLWMASRGSCRKNERIYPNPIRNRPYIYGAADSLRRTYTTVYRHTHSLSLYVFFWFFRDPRTYTYVLKRKYMYMCI